MMNAHYLLWFCIVLACFTAYTQSLHRDRRFLGQNWRGNRRRSVGKLSAGRTQSSNSRTAQFAENGIKPNIIFIMADDLGWNDVGFHNRLVNTPNIDWLARNGIELTDVHALPLCSPSRASLLTGKYPSNNGLQQLVMLEQSKSCLPLEHKILPQYLKEAGYTTKMVGKWHLGSCSKRCLPTHRGFDEFRGILENQASYFNWTYLGVMNRMEGDEPSTRNIGTHLTIQHQLDTEEMILAHNRNKSPLFMYISPMAVHQPLEVTHDLFNRHSFLNSNNPQENQRRKFLGLVAAVDDLVGATIRALKKIRQYKNSIIVFTSDNGGASGDLNFRAPFTFQSFGNNYPLRGGKTSFYEGGTKSPTIFFKPGLPNSVRGSKRDFLMHITDWMPTLLDLAGSPIRMRNEIDGISQSRNLKTSYRSRNKYSVRSEQLIGLTDYTSPQLTSECSDSDAAYRWRDWKLIYGNVASGVVPEAAGMWVEPMENPNIRAITGDSCMRRDGTGKMVARCLFNLKDDPLEQRNLFDAKPGIVQRLLRKINHFKRISVENVFAIPIGVTPRTTRSLGIYTVPRFDFCAPMIDFPLQPRNASCNT